MTRENWQIVGTSVSIVLGVLTLLGMIFRPVFDKSVISALGRESGAWKDLAKVHFAELFSTIRTADQATRALEDQAKELRDLNRFVEEAIKPLATLPAEIHILSTTVASLDRTVQKLEGMSETVAVLKDRLGIRHTDLARPSRSREIVDKEDTQV